MIVLVCGDRAEEYAEAARKQFSYTGMACITYDYAEPVKQLHDGAMLALQMYAPMVNLPVKDIFADSKDDLVLSFFDIWLAKKDIHPAKIAMARINSMTARWEELKMFYTAIIFGDKSAVAVKSETAISYSVLLQNKDRASQDCPNDCAVSNIFDVVVDTNGTTPDEAAVLLVASLRAKMMSALNKPSGNEAPLPSS